MSAMSRRTVFALMAASALATKAEAAETMPMTIGYYPGTLSAALIWIADGLGFYKDAGIQPSLIAVATGPLMNSNTASGALDFSVNPPSNVGLAREQGLGEIFVLGNLQMPWVLIARSGLKTPNVGHYPQVIKDLKGLNWGVYGRGTDGEIFMRAMARDAGLDPEKDMTWIGVGGPATGLPALQTGHIDVYLTIEPAPTVAVELGYGKILVDLRKGQGPADFAGLIYQGIVALLSTSQKRPELVRGLVSAHQRAYCWLMDPANFERLAAMLKPQLPVSGLPEARYREMLKTSLPGFTLTMPAPDFATWNKMLLANKIIKKPLEREAMAWTTVPNTNPKC